MKREKKVMIIDPVGCKAGMDYYDLNLSKAINATGLKSYIASNFTNLEENAFKIFNTEKAISKLSKMSTFLFGHFKAALYVKRINVTHVIMHAFSYELKDMIALLILKCTGVSIILIAHDISSFSGKDSSYIQKFIFEYLTSNIIVHNKYSFNSLVDVYDNASKKISIISHGHFLSLPEKKITREYAREVLNISLNKRIVLFFGQIKKVKGLDILLNALANTSEDIHLIIAGNMWKDDFESYQIIINNLNIGHRVKQEIRYIEDYERELYFKSADLLVIPYKEIFQSGVLLMGMSYSLPVIASDLPANKEIIIDGYNGLLFKSQDVNDLAAQINNYFSNELIKVNLVNNACKTLEDNHSWHNIAIAFKLLI